MPTLGICSQCGKVRRVTADGRIMLHRLAIDVSRAAVPSVGAGRVRPKCPGAGKPPKGKEQP